MQVSLGIDIGGTNTAIGVVSAEGKVLAKNSIPTPSHGDINKYIDEIASAVNSILASAEQLNGPFEVLGIGIGAPNANFYSGTIEEAPNLSFKGIVPFVGLLKAKLPNMPKIIITNDANAATMGEMIYGGAKGMKHFLMYTLGTGVGSGIVVDGKLVYGHDGFAGECGHTMLKHGGRMCGCGIRGHVEAYCSAGGMKRTAFELLAEYNATDSALAEKSFKDLTSKDIFLAAQEGDFIANKVFEITGNYLAQAIANSCLHTAPEAVFLFGGPLAAGELILKPIRDNLDKYLLATYKGKVKILPSELPLGDAAIMGASSLVY